MKQRSRWEIMHDMLMVIQQGNRRITHIIYKTNLNMRTVYPYKDHLITRGHIVYNKPYYDITPKGLELLIHLAHAKRELA